MVGMAYVTFILNVQMLRTMVEDISQLINEQVLVTVKAWGFTTLAGALAPALSSATMAAPVVVLGSLVRHNLRMIGNH